MKKTTTSNLNAYFSILKENKILQKNESVTSHIFVAYLYERLKIKPYELFPQGHGKRGIIDFVYLPKDKDINILVEIKPYGTIGSLGKIDNKIKQLRKYMKTKQKELKLIGRSNNWTIGIITDLINIKVVFRNTKWGSKTNEYLILEKSFSDINKFFKSAEIKAIFNKDLDKRFISRKLWKEDINRYKAIYELLKKYKDLSNGICKKWKNNLPKDFPHGSINIVFNKTIKLLFEDKRKKKNNLFDLDNKYETAINVLKHVVNQEHCKKLIQKNAENYFSLKVPKNTKLVKH